MSARMSLTELACGVMRDRVVTARADPLSGGQLCTDGVDVADSHPRTDCREATPASARPIPEPAPGNGGDTPLDLH